MMCDARGVYNHHAEKRWRGNQTISPKPININVTLANHLPKAFSNMQIVRKYQRGFQYQYC